MLANGVTESDRMELRDNGLSTLGAARLHLGLSYEQSLGHGTLTWCADMQNVTNENAWRESPLDLNQAYLSRWHHQAPLPQPVGAPLPAIM